MKTTIFGVILAAFLVMSVSFIAPIQVQAVETDSDVIKNNIQTLAEQLAYNSDFEALVEDSDLKSVIEKVYDEDLRDDCDTIESLAQDYKDIIEDKEAYNNLCDPELYGFGNSFQQVYESLYELVYNECDLIQEQSVKQLFNVGSQDNLEITEEENVDDESVFVDEQGNIKLPGFLWAGVNWSFVKELVKLFLVFGPIIVVVGVAIAALASVISSLLITLVTTLTTLLTNIGIVVIGLGIVLVVLAIVFAVLYTLLVPPPTLEEVFNIGLNALKDESEESEEESEQVKHKTLVSSINARFRELLKQVFVFSQNLFA